MIQHAEGFRQIPFKGGPKQKGRLWPVDAIALPMVVPTADKPEEIKTASTVLNARKRESYT